MLKYVYEFKSIASVQSDFRVEYKTKIAPDRKVIIKWLQKEKSQGKNEKPPKISSKPWQRILQLFRSEKRRLQSVSHQS